MKKYGELIEPQEIEVTYSKEGKDMTDSFAISTIPGFYALKIHAKAAQILQSGEIASMPDTVVRDLLKYAAHNQVVLDEEVLINTHCATDEVVIAVAMAVWKRNFDFFDSDRFRERMVDLRKLLG